jgi:myo-inositol 2-dehydrogenase/D-chiro-inositol 1-dehydrogenase
MIRFVLIGAGRIGRIHAHNLATSRRVRLVAIADTQLEAAEQLAAQWQARAVRPEEALAQQIDAVLVASSTDTHADWIERCAAAGKPVFCEKPLDLDIERATQCMRTAQRAGIPLYLGFNRRYDPSFAKLKREIDSGSIGSVETLHIVSRDPSPPPIEFIRRSGGLFRDMMIHDFDMARWLLKEEPVEVFARGGVFADPAIGEAGDVDTALVMLRTASGRLCQIVNGRRCTYGYDQRIEAFGEKGMLVADNRTATSVTLANSQGYTSDPALPFFLERYAEAYKLELEDFITALEGKPVQLATPEDGRRALVLADAAQASMESGAPVEVRVGT